MGKGRKRECDMLSSLPRADVDRAARRSRTSMGSPGPPAVVATAATAVAASSPTGSRTASPNARTEHPVTASPRPSRLRPVRLARPCGEDDSDPDDDNFVGLSSSQDDSLDPGNDSDSLEPGTIEQISEEQRKKKRALSLATMTPDNILTPWAELKAHLLDSPCPRCLGKEKDDMTALWMPSLEVDAYPWGATTDVVMSCTRLQCGFQRVISPSFIVGDRPKKDNEDDTSLTTTTTTRQSARAYNPKDYTLFRKYPINYQMILLTQTLGCGTEGLDVIFAHLGIAPARGGYNKWKALQDAMGEAEHTVADEVCRENAVDVVRAYNKQADEIVLAKLPAGTVEEKELQKMDLLHLIDGRIGIAVGMDGAWQRRSIGFGKMNSLSGMNFCVDLLTKKILNCVVYSKQCTTCKRYRSLHGAHAVVPQHRCSQNYNPDDSSKSMEAEAALLHKEDIELKPTGLYIHTLCTDNDSSVRANTKYNRTEYYNAKFGVGGWNKDDEGVHWPYKTVQRPDGTTKKVFEPASKDAGHLNLQCYPVQRYTTDVNHRVKVMLKGVFALKTTAKKVPPGKLALAECHRLKKYAGLFFKKNKQLPFEEFKRRAPCMYLHHFGDHSCCDIEWCKPLQSTRTDGIDPFVMTPAYCTKYRDKNNELDKKVFELVEQNYAPYMTDVHLYQCYHGFDTNKNESLNRKCSATAPKDRHFSGTMSLADRFMYVAIHDSVGHKEAIRRVLQQVGINVECNCPVLEEWARRVDNDKKNKAAYRQKPENKRKRSANISALVQKWSLGERHAASSGKNYATGSAIPGGTGGEGGERRSNNDCSAMTLAELAEMEASSGGSDWSTGPDEQDTEAFGTI